MTSNELRKHFINYFVSKNHKILPSSSLPIDDPTLLFTVAGMVPLKKYFLGEETPEIPRLVSVQRCLRTNDIENVGKTTKHNTFFEMLGNFSIGDYFKEDALSFAFEFLNKKLDISINRLWSSVYPEDSEAKLILSRYLPKERIVETKDNFWQMASTGPCGYDSEIFIDFGETVGCGKSDCSPLCDCGRFVELWNIVFMEFYLDKSGKLTPLPRKNIDTGMGFERITAALNGNLSIFDTDLFIPILSELESISKKNKTIDRSRFNLIADHARAITFLIADGVFPENQKHGYVLRRLIRRAKLAGYILGIDNNFLSRLCDTTINIMSDHYLYLIDLKDKIKLIVEKEEEQFSRTIKDGLIIFNEEKVKTTTLFSGDTAFKLHDTFGFPVELTKEMLDNENIELDKEKFNNLYNEQRKRAKKENSFADTISKTDFWVSVKEFVGNIEFAGYENYSSIANVKCIIKDNISIENESSIDSELIIILDKTPFYPEKGGPVGDIGIIKGENLLFKVNETITPMEGLIIHKGILLKGSIKVGDSIEAKVDKDYRNGIRRAHTATHLLHKALKTIIGDYVNQAGSYIEPDYFRFDFNAFSGLKENEIKNLEDIVNDFISKNCDVITKELPYAEAVSSGATALFKEKYGDKVRVVTIDDISKELCSGIHVKNTIDIRVFRIIKESSIGSNLRRIEAEVGNKAIIGLKSDSTKIKQMQDLLNKPNVDIITSVNQLIENNKEKEIDIKSMELKIINYTSKELINDSEKIGSISFIYKSFKNASNDFLRNLSDRIRAESKNPLLAFIVNLSDITASILLSSSAEFDLTGLFTLIKTNFGLKGGGSKQLIQIGGVESDKIGEILDFTKASLLNIDEKK